MTRFIQYPFDKTKMAEVREWAKGVGLKDLRAVKGVKNVELSFCPGEGWLAARYILCADAPRTLSRTLAHARSHALACSSLARSDVGARGTCSNDLDDMVAFPDSEGYKKAMEAMATAPHQDPSRKPHEFKGFFLEEI